MSSVVHPVGEKPARVYWVRRGLVVLLVLAVLVAVLFGGKAALGFLGGLGSGATAAVTPPAPTSTSTADGPTACGPSDLQLAVTTSAAGYPAGANPELTISVLNSGSRSCTFDASAANREVVVTSGTDRIWSSKDCQGKISENLLLLAAGATAPETVTWDRTRSAAGCPSGLPAPRPGTYKATATVAGITVPAAVFTLD